MLGILCEVNQLVLSLLAVQRALLYFIPSYEEICHISERRLRILFYFLYILDVLYTIYLLYLYAMNEEQTAFQIKYAVDITLNAIFMISTLLYIPILLSIRKVAYLVSVRENQPQRYIAWQMIVVFVEKILCGIMIISLKIKTDEEELYFKEYDCFMMLLVMQLTYIGCNRHNLLTALTSLKSWQGFRGLCCSWIKTTQVEPTNNLAMISSTNMELRAVAVQN